MRPSSATRPRGTQPPTGIPCSSAKSRAARSAPAWPPETIFRRRSLRRPVGSNGLGGSPAAPARERDAQPTLSAGDRGEDGETDRSRREPDSRSEDAPTHPDGEGEPVEPRVPAGHDLPPRERDRQPQRADEERRDQRENEAETGALHHLHQGEEATAVQARGGHGMREEVKDG